MPLRKRQTLQYLLRTRPQWNTSIDGRSAHALALHRLCAGSEDYLLKTWAAETRPAALNLNADKQTKWLSLQVKRAENTSETTAIVEFVARYKIGGKAERLHEISQFVRVEGCWYYLVGTYTK